MSAKFRIGLAAVALVLSLPAMAQVLECIDSNGKKSYMRTCPADTVKQRSVEIASPPVQSTPSERVQKAETLKSEEKAFEQRRQQRLDQQENEANKAEEAADERQACADARRRLEVLSNGRASTRVDPDTGEHIAMDDNARLEEIGRLQSQIQSLGDACR